MTSKRNDRTFKGKNFCKVDSNLDICYGSKIPSHMINDCPNTENKMTGRISKLERETIKLWLLHGVMKALKGKVKKR